MSFSIHCLTLNYLNICLILEIIDRPKIYKGSHIQIILEFLQKFLEEHQFIFSLHSKLLVEQDTCIHHSETKALENINNDSVNLSLSHFLYLFLFLFLLVSLSLSLSLSFSLCVSVSVSLSLNFSI